MLDQKPHSTYTHLTTSVVSGLSLLLTLFLLSGCSTTAQMTADQARTKKRYARAYQAQADQSRRTSQPTCRTTNWFAYGKSLGLKGRHLKNDEQIRSCENVDAQALERGYVAGVERYCSPDILFQIGMAGGTLNRTLCSAEAEPHYRSGLETYCAADNAFAIGASGTPYTGACRTLNEAKFIRDYQKGRTQFLSAEIANNEDLIDALSLEVLSNQRLNQQSRPEPAGRSNDLHLSRTLEKQRALRSVNQRMRVEMTTLL